MLGRTMLAKVTVRNSVILSPMILCLSGCLSGADKNVGDSSILSKTKTTPSSDLVTQIGVANGALVIAAPKGYCIDPTSAKDTDNRAFVPLGACSAMTKNPADPTPEMIAFLTASVLPLPSQASAVPVDAKTRMQAAKEFVESDTGRAALSRGGSKSPVTVLAVEPPSDVLFVQVKDESSGQVPSLSNTNWRAFFEQNGALVTATVTPFKDGGASERQEYRLLTEFVSAIRKANAGGEPQSGGLKKLLDRLRL